MSALTTTLTQPAARFQAVRLPGGRGWTVVDLLDKPAIVIGRTWEQDRAKAWACLLDEAPAYAVLFRWSDPDARPVLRWYVLATGGRAEAGRPVVGGGEERL